MWLCEWVAVVFALLTRWFIECRSFPRHPINSRMPRAKHTLNRFILAHSLPLNSKAKQNHKTVFIQRRSGETRFVQCTCLTTCTVQQVAFVQKRGNVREQINERGKCFEQHSACKSMGVTALAIWVSIRSHFDRSNTNSGSNSNARSEQQSNLLVVLTDYVLVSHSFESVYF